MVLERFTDEYGLQAGPQTRRFSRVLLERGVAEENKAATVTGTCQKDLGALGFEEDGDRALVESILIFSRLLLENCGNRSLYNSSDRLGELLNTTSLSLLSHSLRLAVRLAQRYHAARQRGSNASQHLNVALLASHYNMDLEKVQKLANPFTKLQTSSATVPVPSGATSTMKGKEKAHQSPQQKALTASDLVGIVTDDVLYTNGSVDKSNVSGKHAAMPLQWEAWGSVAIRYYQDPTPPSQEPKPTTPITATSATPTQPRRPSGLSRQSRISSFDESSDTPPSATASKLDEGITGGMKTLEIPLSRIAATPIEEILSEKLSGLPKDAQHELLSKLRVAHAMISSPTTRQQIVGIRLLAITNLAYVYPETTLQQKILQQDLDEPRRLQLTYQLAELVHTSAKNPHMIPLGLQTIAFGSLEALAKHKSKAPDVCAALSINVAHGILLYVLRRAVADIATEDSYDHCYDGDESREALFSLLETLPTSAPRTGETLISAGLLDILVELLNLRTAKAQRNHPKVLTFLNTVIYTVRDAFQTLANLKGLDAISDLIADEVQSGLTNAEHGNGLPLGYRNQAIDYRIPYFQQQTLRWLFKFVNHMMSHGSGNFDRLLRNLIDSPRLLGGLRTVIINGKVFGSSVWSGAVNIMSSFIHNEPTSYAVIAEAGLSKGLLEAITSRKFPNPPVSQSDKDSENPTANQPVQTEEAESDFWRGDLNQLLARPDIDDRPSKSKNTVLAQGILPATDAIVTIPQAFGAICLNITGMDFLVRSGALATFFEVFESPEHVKSMAHEGELARLLGSSFDELVRHHPQLKDLVMRSVLSMIKRVGFLCNPSSTDGLQGARLWTEAKDSNHQASGDDILMAEANGSPTGPTVPPEDSSDDDSQDDLGPATFINVAMKFLSGFFENSSSCSAFVERGGAELVLDLATSDTLKWNFNTQAAGHEISKVIHMLAEQKPHLVLPSLVNRTQTHVDVLEPIYRQSDECAYFSKYIALEQDLDQADAEFGTKLVKSLVSVHTLCNILYETFSGPIYNSRSSHTAFSQVNLADMYVTLVKKLAQLHRACVWEEILLQKSVPTDWNEATKIKGYGMGSEEADEVLGLIAQEDSNTTIGPTGSSQDITGVSRRASSSTPTTKTGKGSMARVAKPAQFKNLMTLRFLLSQVPSSIVPFFQSLGKALVAKRRPDAYARQNAYSVAQAMAEATLDQLHFEALEKTPIVKDRYAYWIVILTSISHLMIEGPLDRPHAQCLTLLLQCFRSCGGLDAVRSILGAFLDEVKRFPPDQTHVSSANDEAARLASAYGGIKIILNFFAPIVTTKAIVESSQSVAIASNDRDRGHPHYFYASQFLVELRMAVLPSVRSMWDSDFVEKASSPIIKRLVEILRTVLEGGEEQGALRRMDKAPQRTSLTPRKYAIHNDKVNTLVERGYTAEVAAEALYRCMNVLSAAEEYCRAQKASPEVPSNPIPAAERETPALSSPAQTPRRSSQTVVPELGSTAPSGSSSGTTAAGLPSLEQLLPLMGHPTGAQEASNEDSGDTMSISIENLLNPADIVPHDDPRSTRSSPSPLRNAAEAETAPDVVTFDDLDDERSEVRKNLIERALDVLNAHDDVTFELAELINASSSKTPGASQMRKDIGETLVQSLISFQAEEDFRPAGKKIAAYANLLALVMQDHDFYSSTLDEIQGQFSALIGFIRIFPTQSADEPSPWIGQILLVLEKILAEDVQPTRVQWSAPHEDGSRPSSPFLEEPRLRKADKKELFEAIVEILPRIGKDESLALSIVRALVVLTRDRKLASRLGEKTNIQRLFVMVKQLAGITNDRLQSSFMLLLRHVVEDDEMIKQIMRSEVLANFESRPTRTTETTGYVRQMYHLVLRSPELFVEVTDELLEIKTYDSSQRPQNLVLKADVQATTNAEAPKPTTEEMDVNEGKIIEGRDAIPNTDEASAGIAQKCKTIESKAPVVENPSGVIHYLLCELLAYKEVVDKDQAAAPITSSSEDVLADSGDIEMEDSVTPTMALPPTRPSPEASPSKKTERPEFKPEQHPIYIYRCFLLQCLTELLRCYNRTKIEFVNFSRRADGKATTPSKPRSNVLNYLLTDVIPIGTLNHEESISFRKKTSTSNWAMSTIVSLCLRTNEHGYEKKRGSLEEDQDTDLQYVRRFVLEHALKAYKDANTSDDSLDAKYARLLCLADLFNRLLTGKIVQGTPGQAIDINTSPQKVLARIMYDKNFISALTGSIADIDLNFPGSKRAVKYILRPLKQLTQTAIVVSETSDDSTTPGQTDEDEISSATSVSEVEDEREETPDLFRHSTLGMFEPGREQESSSESSDDDEDMYDDEFEEGMEYEDEMERDEDEVVSDEDEEIEGVGHLEGLPGDASMNVEVVIEPDDELEDDMSEDEEDEDEDEDDSEDMDDNGEDIEEVSGEINGDEENNSLAEGDDEEWQDEDEEQGAFGDEVGMDIDLGNEDDPDSAASAVRNIAREFADGPAALRDLALEMDGDFGDDGGADDDGKFYITGSLGGQANGVQDAEDDDDDDEEDEDVIYQPEYDGRKFSFNRICRLSLTCLDEDVGMPDPPWGWMDPEGDVTTDHSRHHHHHHHPRRISTPWHILPHVTGGPGDRRRISNPISLSLDDIINAGSVPTWRHHRPNTGPRTVDDGINPLLQRNDRGISTPRPGHAGVSDAAAGISDYWVHGMEQPQPRGMGESPVSFISNIIAAVGQGGTGFASLGGPHGALHLHVGGGRGHVLPRELQSALGLRQPPQESTRFRDDPMQAATFVPAPTAQRWQEEARLLYGNAHAEKVQRIVNSLLRVLVPPALEREKQRKEEEAKVLQLAREAAEKKAEEDRKAKEVADKEAREKKEQEEREGAAAAEAVTASSAAANDTNNQAEEQDEDAMEGVEVTAVEEPVTSTQLAEGLGAGGETSESGPSQPAERVRTTIRGRELDITGMGIDLEYLDALPEELREEVLMSQLAIQRSEAAAAGQEPTDISREFLEALPPDIREELLQQEAQDRRRRERDEARRRAAAEGGGPPRAEEMDPASFLASLDPHLRQAVLMEQDEEVLAQLPQAIAAEARALGGDRVMHRFGDLQRLNRIRGIDRDDLPPPSSTQKPQRRQIRQMLDKAGVPTLLRLMFVQQQGSSRQTLNGILHDVSQNKQNRAEVISLLLSILQDGTADVNAVERSFTSLSLRAKQPAAPKTPQTPKRALTNQISPLNNSEMTPLMVVQQCLAALVSLTQYNASIPFFFLTEHEVTSGLKGKSSRKGKAKETKASKYALNALLSLLDRKLIMESSGCMEQLSSLLQSVTHPLTMLLRKEKDKAEESDKPTIMRADDMIPDLSSRTENDSHLTHDAGPDGDWVANPTPNPDAQPPVSDAAQENPPTTVGAADAEPKLDAIFKPTDEKAKKPKSLTPPAVPEENLRLVVNILAARECSGKTFRDTLSTINNLSAIPEAKEVFGRALIEQAKALGLSILDALNDLIPQIKDAESGADIQGMALAKFSPASSDQAKLLRVLTALDYLFDPKRNGGKTQPAMEGLSESGDPSTSKEDLLTTLYEHPTFGALWAKLSECLSTIRQGDGTLSLSTILLPLIEALMVVCKNTTIKDAPLVKAAKDFAITSPPPESRMETLFFRFTEDHRKILNDLVRNNPKLMSGTFSLLVKNPKVLEFDNKRNYFTRRLHSRGAEQRHPQPPLQLSIRRDQVFLDSFKSLSYKSGEEIKYGKLSIRFNGEEGVDAGGVSREWFQVLSRQMFNPDYALFIPVASDRTTFHPNKLSKINEEHLMFFKFIGRIIGKALYEGRALDCHFSRAVYKRILGKSVSIKDMETLDLDYYKSLLWMLENDITEIITETFSVETDDFGVREIVDLVENGRNIPVTEENKHEYVQLVVEHRLTGSVKSQLEQFLKGMEGFSIALYHTDSA